MQRHTSCDSKNGASQGAAFQQRFVNCYEASNSELTNQRSIKSKMIKGFYLHLLRTQAIPPPRQMEKKS